MKRLFTIAALAVGLIIAGNINATAGDYHHGGHHAYSGGHQAYAGGHQAYSGGHQGGYQHGGYTHAPIPSYGNHGYSSNYGGHGGGYGQTYQPRYQQQHAPSYRPQSYGQQGGLHIDIGRFHVLGAGGHHH